MEGSEGNALSIDGFDMEHMGEGSDSTEAASRVQPPVAVPAPAPIPPAAAVPPAPAPIPSAAAVPLAPDPVSSESTYISIPAVPSASGSVPVPGAPMVPAAAGEAAADGGKRTAGQVFFSVVKFVVAAVFVFIAMIVQALGFYVAYGLNLPDLESTAVAELVGAGAAILGIVILGGKKILKFSLSEVADAFRACWWMLIADGVLTLYLLWDTVASGTPLVEGWPASVAVCLLLCLGVGLFEEAAFRGLFLGGFLGTSGRTKAGIFIAAIGSALVFGAVHVFPADPSELYPLGIAQMVLKTLQTGICGLIWAAILIDHESLWGAALVHGFVDFMMFAGEALFTPPDELMNTEYVSTNEAAAMELVIFYSIVIISYIPIAVRAFKMLRDEEAPNFGWFHKTKQDAQLAAPAPMAAAGAYPIPGAPAAYQAQGQMPLPIPASGPAPTQVPTPTYDAGSMRAPQVAPHMPQQGVEAPLSEQPLRTPPAPTPYDGQLPIPMAEPLPGNVPASHAMPVPPKGWPER